MFHSHNLPHLWKRLEKKAVWRVWQHMFKALIVSISCHVEPKRAAAGCGSFPFFRGGRMQSEREERGRLCQTPANAAAITAAPRRIWNLLLSHSSYPSRLKEMSRWASLNCSMKTLMKKTCDCPQQLEQISEGVVRWRLARAECCVLSERPAPRLESGIKFRSH